MIYLPADLVVMDRIRLRDRLRREKALRLLERVTMATREDLDNWFGSEMILELMPASAVDDDEMTG